MAVHVTFYWTPNQRNVIHKQIESLLSTTAELYDNTDIFNPELKLAWNDNYATDYNYFYILEFSRYYFLDDVVAEPGGAARIKGSVDVLYTYLNAIDLDIIVITRAYYSRPDDPMDPSGMFLLGGAGPTDIADNKLPLKQRRDVRAYLFNEETGNNYIANNNGMYNFVLNIMGRAPD